MLAGWGRRLSSLAGSPGHSFPAVEAADGEVSQPRLLSGLSPGSKSEEGLSSVVGIGCPRKKEGLLLDNDVSLRNDSSLEFAGLRGFLMTRFFVPVWGTLLDVLWLFLTSQCFSRL